MNKLAEARNWRNIMHEPDRLGPATFSIMTPFDQSWTLGPAASATHTS